MASPHPLTIAGPRPSDAALLLDRLRPAESFETFYRRHSPGILTFCARQRLTAHDAADVTADIFVAALCARYGFDADQHGQSATPWLYGITSNVLNGRHRKTARERAAHERLQQPPLSLTERDVAEYAELQADVARALELIADLPPDQRAAVIGKHLHDAAYVELAEAHGVSEQVVRQRVSRALSSVRGRMGARS